MKTISAGVLAAAALVLGSAAQAHPRLLSASPTANAKGPTPTAIRLSFSESLIPKFCRIAVTDRAGHKAPLGPSTVTGGKQLSVPVKGKLAPGAYKVAWSAVSTDTHRVSGTYAFTVTR